MNTFKLIRNVNKVIYYTSLILKGILLFGTILTFLVFASGIDSICENGYPLVWIFILIFGGCMCYKFISIKDVEILTFNKTTDDKLD